MAVESVDRGRLRVLDRMSQEHFFLMAVRDLASVPVCIHVDRAVNYDSLA